MNGLIRKKGLQYVNELLCRLALIGLIACFQEMYLDPYIFPKDSMRKFSLAVDMTALIARYNYQGAVPK